MDRGYIPRNHYNKGFPQKLGDDPIKEAWKKDNCLMTEVTESIRKRETKTTRAQCMRERASFSHLSKVRRIIPVLMVSGVQVPGIRLGPTCFPSFLLFWYFSPLFCADSIFK